MSHDKGPQHHVVIVGGGFAGLGCAQRLAGHDAIHVTLIDRNNYHQFQPLLYQVATSQLAPSDIAYSLRAVFADDPIVDVKLAHIAEVDPVTRTVTSSDGQAWSGDVLVLAGGSQPNFFGTWRARLRTSFPLYSLDDATRLRSRILGLVEQVHLLDCGDALLKPFSDRAHAYVPKVLAEKGVHIHLGTGVKEVGTGHAVFLGRHDR